MCTGAEIALLALAAGGTAYGTISANNNAKAAGRKYNNEVSAQNKMLSEQYADRTAKINEARDAQAEVFKNIGVQQDEEFARQTELAKKKQQVFQQSVEQPVIQNVASPEFADAVASRNKMYEDSALALPADYGASANGETENRVLRDAAEKALTLRKDRSGKMADALSRMGAVEDTGQKRAELFRALDINMGDVAQDAATSANTLSTKLRTPEYRMGALSAVMGENANTPYYRGTEPMYRTPNTLWSDLAKGGGQLGMNAYFMGAGAPKTTNAPTTYGPFYQPGA